VKVRVLAVAAVLVGVVVLALVVVRELAQALESAEVEA
jgi:hypothetical protein